MKVKIKEKLLKCLKFCEVSNKQADFDKFWYIGLEKFGLDDIPLKDISEITRKLEWEFVEVYKDCADCKYYFETTQRHPYGSTTATEFLPHCDKLENTIDEPEKYYDLAESKFSNEIDYCPLFTPNN